MSLARKLMSGFALALVLSACEDDMMEPETDLTMEEAVALLKAAGALLADTTVVPIHVSMDSTVVPCPLGGQAKLVGPFIGEEAGDTVRFGADILITPTGCVVAADGLQFTVDPGPALRYQLLVEIIGFFEEVNISGMITGGVDWQLDDRTGNCVINLTLEAVPDLSDPQNPGVTGVYKGMLCDHEVEIPAEDLLVPVDL